MRKDEHAGHDHDNEHAGHDHDNHTDHDHVHAHHDHVDQDGDGAPNHNRLYDKKIWAAAIGSIFLIG